MTQVKHYHLTETGLVEGEALGRLSVVLGADHDHVTAELVSANADKEAYAQNAIDLRKRVDALQQRLTAADERADALEGLLREIRQSCELSKLRDAQIDSALNSAASPDFSMIGTEKMPPMEYDEP